MSAVAAEESRSPVCRGCQRLVASAADGEQRAWDALVGEFSSLVWAIARAHGCATPTQPTWRRPRGFGWSSI